MKRYILCLILLFVFTLNIFPLGNKAAPSSDTKTKSKEEILKETKVTQWISPDNSKPTPYVKVPESTLKIEQEDIAPPAHPDGVKPPLLQLGEVAIVVNATLYSGIEGSLSQYCKILQQEGYAIQVYMLSSGTAEQLRSFLRNELSRGLLGAIFIGELPIAWYETNATGWGYEQFPCDLFFMDLNGNWIDENGNGLYDNRTGNIAPEIWVGRIYASTLGDEVDIVNNYLWKDIGRRQNWMNAGDPALIYIDDDWVGMTNEVNQSLSTLYRTIVVNDTLTTNASDYMQRLQSNSYSWVHIQCHGYAGGHCFKVGNDQWDGWVFSQDYTSNGLNPHVSFFNFFVCSNARYVEPDYLAGSAVFNSDQGLLAVGSTKTGSMLSFGDFYPKLSQGKSIGEAFREWFALNDQGQEWQQEWFYGMTLIGDPTFVLSSVRVYGWVKAQDGTPISSTLVEVRDYATNYLYGSTTTGNDGYFQVTVSAPVGSYSLELKIDVPSPPSSYYNYTSGNTNCWKSTASCHNITLTAKFGSSQLLFVVDNDGNYQATFQPVDPQCIIDMLNNLGISHVVWSEKEQGIPPIAVLRGAQMIYWHAGTYWHFSIDPYDEKHLLKVFHEKGIKLGIDGQDIGYDHGSDDFMTSLLHARYLVDDTDLLWFMTTNLSGRLSMGLPRTFDLTQDTGYPDGVVAVSGGVERLHYYNASSGQVSSYAAAISHDYNGSRVFYFSSPINFIREPARSTFIRDIILWLQSGDIYTLIYPSKDLWMSCYNSTYTQVDNIHIANPGARDAIVTFYIGGSIIYHFTVPAGSSPYVSYPAISDKPLHIVSTEPVSVTQRIVGWNGFKEVPALPSEVASTEIYYTWYDGINSKDYLYVINPSEDTYAYSDVYIGVDHVDAITIPPKGAIIRSYSKMGGPLKIISTIPILSTQRILGWDDFEETLGTPAWYAYREHWFTWYDFVNIEQDNIHMLNLGKADAHIQVYIAGVKRGEFVLPADQATYVSFKGVMGGPVRVTSDQPIRVTRRILGWNGFKELMSVPTESLTTKWYYTWYDFQNAPVDNIHIINPGSSSVTVKVYIAGTLKSTLTLNPGDATYVNYKGVCSGPVIIDASGPIMTTQRIVGWGSFEETIGMPWP